VLLSRKFVKAVENDAWQPNPYGLEVARRKTAKRARDSVLPL
jgi:hypothetical protein